MTWLRFCLAFALSIGSGGATIAAAAPSADPDVVQVYFSRDPESLNDFTAVFPVARDVAGGPGIEERTLMALLQGPSVAEQAAGYFSDFAAVLVGPMSVCKGLDFTLRVVGGTATVNLCRATASAGIGQDARTHAEVEATLHQFPWITNVVVLDLAGHCLFDQSGLDLCILP